MDDIYLFLHSDTGYMNQTKHKSFTWESPRCAIFAHLSPFDRGTSSFWIAK